MVQTKIGPADIMTVNLQVSQRDYYNYIKRSVADKCSLSETVRDEHEHYKIHGYGEDEALSGTEYDGFTVITWVNNVEMYRNLVVPALAPQSGFQQTTYPVQFLGVPPEVGARNIGEAYEIARKLARHKIKIYIHQDALPVDWHWLEKVRIAHMAGVGATGVIGSTVPTGSAWFHRQNPMHTSGYIDMASGRIVGDADCRVRVVDPLVFTCSLDIPWSSEYEGPHMAVEDMCLRIEAAGSQVWTLSTQFVHLSPGSMDGAFWRSVRKLRETWADTLPSDLPSIDELYEFTKRERDTLGMDMSGKFTPDAIAIMEKMNRDATELMTGISSVAPLSVPSVPIDTSKQVLGYVEAEEVRTFRSQKKHKR